jgi:hypothetical protein
MDKLVKARRFRDAFILLAATLLAMLIFHCVRSSRGEDNDAATVHWVEGGEAMTAYCEVYSPTHGPVPGALVTLEDDSGGTSGITDENGRVLIEKGETAVTGIEVNGTRVMRRDCCLGVFAPKVTRGLLLTIELK